MTLSLQKLFSAKAVCSIALCICCAMQWQLALAQNKDSKGKEFWLMFNRNYNTPAVTLFLTANVNTTGKVEIPGLSFTQNFSITANAVTSVVLPNAVAIHTNDVIDSKGIHVTAADEITVYGLNYIQFTTDAYLGLPVDALGTDYIILTYKNSLVAGVEFGVVSTADNNQVTITPSVTTGARTAGVPYTITLNKGQTYELSNTSSNTADFTGTTITSTMPIGVYGGHQCGNVPGGSSYCDHLCEMLPPTSTWGRKFGTVPLKARIRGDTWRFLASENGTVVTINGVAEAPVNRGQFVEKVLTDQSVIESNKPILVCQYANGSTYSGNPGDPFMMLIPPLEQFLANYTVTTVSGYVSHYINIMAPTSIAGTLTLDGNSVPAASYTPIGTTGFSGAQIQVQPGSHTLVGSLPFGVFMYGFNQDDSYGYPGGQSFSEVAIVKSLSIIPETASSDISHNYCFYGIVKDQFNNPVKDVRVDFVVKGKHPRNAFAVTNERGEAQFCYQGTSAGIDSIIASVGALSDTSIFTWEDNQCHISVAVTTTNAHGDAYDGTAQLVASGGTPPYTYTMKGETNTTGFFSGLNAGPQYLFGVKDSRNCEVGGSVIIMRDVIQEVRHCPKDTVIMADPVSCLATLSWEEPNAEFPDSIGLPPAYNVMHSKLMFRGTYNGHGYYVSNGFYPWTQAAALSVAKGGHLVTITSQGESDFIFDSIRQGQVYGPWIGLFNTGLLGQFEWVTGEPVSFTNWAPSEPNNKGGHIDSIAEQYVHIWGWDPQNRWNDLTRLYYLAFIAEFENPVLIYRQISGPSNGSTQKPGIYTVCYEIVNRADNTKDTCCFTIEVKCVPALTLCPKDTTIQADPATCKAVVTWTLPDSTWPASINIPDGLFSKNNTLTLTGLYNGHAYYYTPGGYRWLEAKEISENLSGHLVTITSAGENSFVYSNFRQSNVYGPWIGLFNTGLLGQFEWVTGEPVSYTNWFPTEPNNKGGNLGFVSEPYVLINGYDYLNRWNDINRTQLAGFIAEFDEPIITYKQVSGPEYGSEQSAGEYEVCYEITNHATNETINCCFKVTVTCGENNINTLRSTTLSGKVTEPAKLFKAAATPNPSVTNFKVRVASDNLLQRVTIQIADVSGRIMETRTNIAPNSFITVGDNFSRGIYFIYVIQGTKKEVIKVVKQ